MRFLWVRNLGRAQLNDSDPGSRVVAIRWWLELEQWEADSAFLSFYIVLKHPFLTPLWGLVWISPQHDTRG